MAGMGSRRRAREFVLQALFDADSTSKPVTEALDSLWEGLMDDTDGGLGGRPADSEEIEFASQIALGVEETKEDLDRRLQEASTNWRVSRMPFVDRNILRLGAFELLNLDKVPANVTINEAVELAKKYGTKETKGFVNGLLDRIARDIGRL